MKSRKNKEWKRVRRIRFKCKGMGCVCDSSNLDLCGVCTDYIILRRLIDDQFKGKEWIEIKSSRCYFSNGFYTIFLYRGNYDYRIHLTCRISPSAHVRITSANKSSHKDRMVHAISEKLDFTGDFNSKMQNVKLRIETAYLEKSNLNDLCKHNFRRKND